MNQPSAWSHPLFSFTFEFWCKGTPFCGKIVFRYTYNAFSRLLFL